MNKLVVRAVAAGILTWATAFGDGVAAADDVLVVPGTAPPQGPAKRFYHFQPQWVPNIAGEYYDNPGATNNPGGPGVTPKIITYPEANPTSSASSVSVGKSVATGANNLDAAIRANNGPMTVVGLSQGAEVITEEQLRLEHDPTAPPPDQITFIKVSDPAIVLRRLFRPGTHLPYFDYTVPPPVESQYNTVNVVAQYDFVGDPPDHWSNLLAVLNSGMGLQHSMVAFSDPASVPPQNIAAMTNSRGATVTTYRVPEQELPLTTTLRQLGVPNADSLDPVMRPIVDSAYNRNNPSPFAGMNLNDLENAATTVGQLPHIIPAITIPIESTNAGITGATTTLTAANLASNGVSLVTNAASGVNAVTDVARVAGAATNAVSGAGVANVARVAGAATKAVSGANAAKGSKGALPKVGALLLNGKK
ncbi:PE-PPE domain-containing protein [Mycobacterium sp.]|uniref:PE-PPE domain-containing protein n=1 Tax=Mycobacterium sp. TaxID=1785 RepID=UPI003F96BF86